MLPHVIPLPFPTPSVRNLNPLVVWRDLPQILVRLSGALAVPSDDLIPNILILKRSLLEPKVRFEKFITS